MARIKAARYTKDLVIPSPPRKDEYYQYLGKQQLRIMSVVLFVLSMGVVYGLLSLGLVWYPFLLLLVVLIPWTVYIIVLATYRPRITWESHEKVKTAGAFMLSKSVDIFIPVCGEELSIIENTLRNVTAITYNGRLRIYVLDDGNSLDVKALAAKYAANYRVRPDRPAHKKSGNLNYGLSHSDAEFVVVFDADFAPAPDFLLELMPYMLYANIGIVQSTQYFDVSRAKTRNWIQQLSGSMQDMFFCWAQPARNTADASMCVGTNVIYRREALTAIGGFPRVDSGGEDIVTGLDMYTAGYRTLYVPLNLAKGVCPDNFASAVNQQYRWALSTMKLFVGKNVYSKSLKDAPLSMGQKIVFWSGILYYAQSILVLIIAVVPSIIMLWFYPYLVGIGNYLPIAPALVGMFALPLIIRGWRLSSLRIIVVYSVAHLLAAIDTFRGSSLNWISSGATKSIGSIPARAGWVVRLWVLISQSVTWAGIIVGLPVYSLATYWPAIVLTAFQTIVLFPLLLPNYGIVAQPSLLPELALTSYRNRK
jgi:cellulose synthase/poly-beta-1,6-N-acetylglucosamine synthase-like glycosyltransferase